MRSFPLVLTCLFAACGGSLPDRAEHASPALRHSATRMQQPKSGGGWKASGDADYLADDDLVAMVGLVGLAAIAFGVGVWLVARDGSARPPPPAPRPARPTYDDMDLDEIFQRKPANPPAEPVRDPQAARP